MAEASLWFLLLKLAKLGAVKKPIFTSTTTLASELQSSQQTTSRWLKTLSEKGYIKRRIEAKGEEISLTDKGAEELRGVYRSLSEVLKPRRTPYLTICGRLFTGLNEGAYYISKAGYRHNLIEKLGFKPYPGTFNLRISKPIDLQARKELEMTHGITIDGFRNGYRTYGSLKCYPALINDKIKGAVIFIQRTHYDSAVVEVIAPVYLRDALKVKDHDLVCLKVYH
jgi:riboflavin kinase